MSAPPATTVSSKLRAGLQIRIAEHQEGAERAFFTKAVEHIGIAAHANIAVRGG